MYHPDNGQNVGIWGAHIAGEGEKSHNQANKDTFSSPQPSYIQWDNMASDCLVLNACTCIQLASLNCSETLRNKSGWTTLHGRQQIAMVCLVHRCFQKQAPPNSEFGLGEPEVPTSSPYSDRTLNFYRNTFEFQGTQCYNNLPSSMRQILNRTIFRSVLVSTCWNEPQCFHTSFLLFNLRCIQFVLCMFVQYSSTVLSLYFHMCIQDLYVNLHLVQIQHSCFKLKFCLSLYISNCWFY